MSGKRQKTQTSRALERVARGEPPVSDHEGAEPLVAKPAPESPALQAYPDRTAVVRDPYARWCGRGGTARCPPIPIHAPKQTSTRHVGRVIALSVEPFYNPSGRSSIGSQAAPINGNRYSRVGRLCARRL